MADPLQRRDDKGLPSFYPGRHRASERASTGSPRQSGQGRYRKTQPFGEAACEDERHLHRLALWQTRIQPASAKRLRKIFPINRKCGSVGKLTSVKPGVRQLGFNELLHFVRAIWARRRPPAKARAMKVQSCITAKVPNFARFPTCLLSGGLPKEHSGADLGTDQN